MQSLYIIIFLINFYIIITSSIECYFGRSTTTTIPVDSQICDTAGVGITYCMRMATGNDIIRGCDTQSICKNLGTGCKSNTMYSYYTGELCCCNSNKCNSSSRVLSSKSGHLSIILYLASFFTIFMLTEYLE
uniref:Activin_recp domain-containing protein n=1 Tax=Parastrongyloides trichosuri TaxID=131310 RepID=A0A0N5A3K3_PARTI